MKYLLIIVVVLLIGATLYIQQTRRSNMSTKITPQEAKELHDKGGFILDVREPNEFAAGHIPGAINLPLAGVENLISSVTTDKDAVLLVHCQSGRRSAIAAQNLTNLGYTKVYDFGGIIDWPYEVVRD